MDIKNTLDLSKLADVCRKKGIAEIKVTKSTVEFKLWDHIPAQRAKRKSKSTANEKDDLLGDNTPTEEDLLFWSSGGPPPIPAEGKN